MAKISKDNNLYSFVSITVEIPEKGKLISLQSIDYGQTNTPVKVTGAGGAFLGYTSGEYEAKDSKVTLLKSEYSDLVKSLGDDYSQYEFPVTVSYREGKGALVVDVLERCKIVEDGESHSKGGDALTTDLTVSVAKIKRNGVYMRIL